MNIKSYLSTGEVAQFLGVHKVSVLRWIKERQLNAVKIGNSFRIEKETLDDFINRRKLW